MTAGTALTIATSGTNGSTSARIRSSGLSKRRPSIVQLRHEHLHIKKNADATGKRDLGKLGIKKRMMYGRLRVEHEFD